MIRKAIFIDRDGTLIEEVGYLKMMEDLRFTTRAPEAIRIFRSLGFLNIIVTNQSAVARGMLSPKDLNKIHHKLKELAAQEDARIDDIFFCPHLPEGRMPPYNTDCECRKPKPGMILQAQQKYHLDLQQCILVGDKISDLQMSQNAGIRGVLVLTGYGKQTQTDYGQPVEAYPNLYEFALKLKETA